MNFEDIAKLDDICENGCYTKRDKSGIPKLSFNLREAAKYVKENSLNGIDDEIKKRFEI